MRNFFLSILTGTLLAISWPTYGIPLFLFVAFVPLLMVEKDLRQRNKKNGWIFFGHAYLAMLIWNAATTWWLVYASVFGMLFAVLVNSLLMAIVWRLYHGVARKLTWLPAIISLVCAWMAFEWLHLHWDFSWPWLNLGNGFSDWVDMVQWYEFTGTFGGTLWVWVVNLLVFTGITGSGTVGISLKAKENKPLRRNLIIATGVIVVPIILSYLIKPAKTLSDKTAEVVILQPNIDPYEEKYELTNDSVGAYLVKLARPAVTDETDFVISPETSLAKNVELDELDDDRGLWHIRRMLQENSQVSYLGGISMIEFLRAGDSKISEQTNYLRDDIYYNDFNSAIFLRRGEDDQLYHKSKLVVGIENMPYKGLLEPVLGNAMIDLGGTVATKTTQEERAVFTHQNGTKAAPIICYESVYGEYVTGYVHNGADFLAVITNDAWWEETEGHRQHLALSRLRAIENRRYVARSANTGISAIIDHRGEIIDQLGYAKQGIVKGTIELSQERTFYAEYGDYLAWGAVLIFGILLLIAATRKTSVRY